MKTLTTILTIATLSFFTNTSKAQLFVNDGTLFGQEIEVTNFAIAELNVKSSNSNINFEWEAYNQTSVIGYEIQLSEDNTNFSTIKKVKSQPTAESKYQIQLSNTIILADVVYCRVKTNLSNGTSVYTNSYRVKIKSK